jgi:O-antigen ligase
MESKTQKKTLLNEIGSLSDGTLSLAATLAMGVLFAAPLLMAIMAMFKQSIDFTMNIYLSMIKNLVFPLACSIVLVIYIIVVIRMHERGESFKEILKKNPTFIIFFLCALFIVGSQFYNGAQYALTGFCAAALGETFGMELSYIVFILFGATQVKVESHKRFLLRAHLIISSVLVLAAFVLWHSQVESSFFSDWTPRFSSIFSNINYYGYYLSLTVGICGAAFVYEKKLVWKIVAGGAFIANSVALSIDDTMGSWIGGIVAVLFIVIALFIIEKKVNWQALALIPVFALCLYIPGHITGNFEQNFSALSGDIAKVVEGGAEADSAGSARWRIWKASMDIVKANPIFGIGFEGVKQKGYVGAPYNIRPHNEFMQYALFHGIPCALVYIAGCLAVFIRALRKRKELNGATLACLAGAIGYLASSFFGLTVFSTAYFLFVFLGMGYVSGAPVKASEGAEVKKTRYANAMIAFVMACVLLIYVLVSGIAGIINTNNQKEAADNNQQQPVEAAPEESKYDQLGLKSVTDSGFKFYIYGDEAIVAGVDESYVFGDIFVIPDKLVNDGKEYPVTIIGESAFEYCNDIKQAAVPRTVVLIEANAFDSCEELVNIELSEGLEIIGEEAFNGCTSLESVILPSTVSEIGNDIFYYCESLKSVTLSENITEIPGDAFFGCTSLTDVKLPKNLECIDDEAFRQCEALKEIELPEGLVLIGEDAFTECSSLNNIKLPSTLISVASTAFDYCDSLKNVFVPKEKLAEYKEIFTDVEFSVRGY